jgi:hypothetical protein
MSRVRLDRESSPPREASEEGRLMNDATLRSVLQAYTLYKKGKIDKSGRLVWQTDGGRLFIRRECCGKITNITTYEIVHALIADEIIGYSMNCIHCAPCNGYATHFVLDRWKPPSATIATCFRYGRKVMGDDLWYAIGGVGSHGPRKEWVHLYSKKHTNISVQWKDTGFFAIYNRDGKRYETLAEALKAGAETYRHHT